MPRGNRVPNEALLEAGLDLMRQAGKPLERLPAKGRAMIFRSPAGETVRVRTCNDPILVALANSVDEDARLNIEGTDYLLIVMPEEARTYGPVIAYLVPTGVAADAVRKAHRGWLASDPHTKGDNRTWNIWFDDKGPAACNGFAKKWAEYRLGGEASTSGTGNMPATDSIKTRPGPKLGDVIAEAKSRIAEVAGVPPEAVKITVDLS